MTYTKSYSVNENHIDVQGIMDGLYYPFYLEYCRHDFVKDILNFGLEENAKEGINMVLSEYTIKFLRPLRMGDAFNVTCSVISDKEGKPKIYFRQNIQMNGKLVTEATFTATCILASGGKPFVPEQVLQKVRSFEQDL